MTLVVVDMQRVFGDPASPWCAPRFASIVEPVRRLVDYYDLFPFALVATDDAVYDLVEPFSGRATLDRTTFGKWGPELAAMTSDELVVAGVSTDCCVIATALAAADAGRHVRVVADACAGADDIAHEQSIDVMRRFAPLIEITDVDALIGA